MQRVQQMTASVWILDTPVLRKLHLPSLPRYLENRYYAAQKAYTTPSPFCKSLYDLVHSSKPTPTGTSSSIFYDRHFANRNGLATVQFPSPNLQ